MFAFLLSPLSLAAAAAPPRRRAARSIRRSIMPAIAALVEEVQPYRRARLIDWDAFIAAAGEPGVLILDARSAEQFAAGHIRGAVNLPLPEFSAAASRRSDRPGRIARS